MRLPRATFFFEHGKIGWSETHYLYGEVESLSEVIKAARTLAGFRAGLLKEPAKLTAIRASWDDVWRDSLMHFSEPGENASLPYAESSSVMGVGTSLLLRCESGPFYRKNIYLSGGPGFLANGSEFNPDVNWLTNYKKWINRLKEVWGWKTMGNDPVAYPQKRIMLYTNDQTVTVAAHGFVAGDKVLLHGLKQLDGTRYGQNVEVTEVLTANTFKVSNAPRANTVVPTSAWARKQVQIVVPYSDKITITRAVSRKRGRPFDVPHGRRKPRS